MFHKVHRIAKEWEVAAYNACFNRPIGYIYMFHMVRPKCDLLAPIDELRVSPEFFEVFLKERGKHLDFISMDEIPSRLGELQRGNKPFGVITFDDGYADNFTYAYPILKELNIPFAIYVSAGLVNEHKPIWNYPLIIERVIKKNDILVIRGKKIECKTNEQKNKTFVKLKSLLFSLPYKHLQEEFKMLFADYLDESVFPNDMLSWKQIEELSEDSLCTIGCHTMTHCRLTITDTKALEYELFESKRLIEQHIGKQVEHVSYPYGWKTDVSSEAKAYTQQIGYQTALISWGGPIRKNDTDIYALKRIMIHE